MAEQRQRIADSKKEFMKVFNGLCYSRNGWEVWADVITMIACSLSNATDHTQPRYDAREKEYAECAKRLGGIEKASELFAIIVQALERDADQDLLGSLYMELSMGNKWKGQFFTPYNISRAMAEMTLGDCPQAIDNKGWISICDPCVGGGAMLIASANVLESQKINYQKRVLFVGQDIDRIVGMMAYIQLSLMGCPGYIVVADSLVNPIVGNPLMPAEQPGQEFWYTPFYNTEVWNYRRMFYNLDALTKKYAKGNQRIDTNNVFWIFYFNQEDNEMADILIKPYKSGAEKLGDEQNKCIEYVDEKYKETAKMQYGIIFSELIKKCEDDPAFDALVLQEHKSWKRCMKYASEKVMEMLHPTDDQKRMARENGQPIVAPVSSDDLFKWIDEYYNCDDKEKVEKELKKAEPKKKTNNQKSVVATAKKQRTVDKDVNKKGASTPKKNSMDGQLDLFELLMGGIK